MRSHLSPHSALSASGSAPVSNSASEHSRAFTVNSLKSLGQSSSISSTDRRLVRPSPGEVSPHYLRWAAGTPHSALPCLLHLRCRAPPSRRLRRAVASRRIRLSRTRSRERFRASRMLRGRVVGSASAQVACSRCGNGRWVGRGGVE
jgi:hypothetical protein